ncbi:MAG: VOC family protein [Candidatus Saccharimonadales bacterium]
MKEIIGKYETFIARIDSGLAASGIDRKELAMMDHICYRVETQNRYNEMLDKLNRAAILLGESVVSGRNIATFELYNYLEVNGWTVPYLELPEPKENSPYPEGLEHAEMVVIGGLARFAKKHSDLKFDTKGMSKDINPELGLKTDLLSVKFHEQPLGAVVRIEQRLGRA